MKKDKVVKEKVETTTQVTSPCRFAVGDLVLDKSNNEHCEVVHCYLDEPRNKWSGKAKEREWYIAVTGLSTSLSFIPDGTPPKTKRNVKWINVALAEPVKIQHNSFALDALPDVVLSHLFEVLPVANGSFISVVNKKFSLAFLSNTAWRNRCERDIEKATLGKSLEEEFNAQKLKSWMEFYKQNAMWKIRLVTIFHHRGGCSLSGDITISVPPTIKVKDFCAKMAAHKDNRQGPQTYVPFDPSKMFVYSSDGNYESIYPKEVEGPNCTFDSSNPEKTIREAGLCRNAALSQPECCMCD